MPLPERGVPEGSEDLQSVVECVPELEQTPEHKPKAYAQCESPDSPPVKAKPFLSKSLDGTKQSQSVKKFVHNVDEQLRRKNDEQNSSAEASPLEQQPHVLRRQDEFDNEPVVAAPIVTSTQSEFRSKFIINCESTVFEHTGVSYETSSEPQQQSELQLSITQHNSVAGLLERDTPIAQPASQLRSSFMGAPIAKTFSNFFRSLKENSSSSAAVDKEQQQKQKVEQQQQQLAATDSYFGKEYNEF